MTEREIAAFIHGARFVAAVATHDGVTVDQQLLSAATQALGVPTDQTLQELFEAINDVFNSRRDTTTERERAAFVCGVILTCTTLEDGTILDGLCIHGFTETAMVVMGTTRELLEQVRADIGPKVESIFTGKLLN